jgi:hypothetical protein
MQIPQSWRSEGLDPKKQEKCTGLKTRHYNNEAEERSEGERKRGGQKILPASLHPAQPPSVLTFCYLLKRLRPPRLVSRRPQVDKQEALKCVYLPEVDAGCACALALGMLT